MRLRCSADSIGQEAGIAPLLRSVLGAVFVVTALSVCSRRLQQEWPRMIDVWAVLKQTDLAQWRCRLYVALHQAVAACTSASRNGVQSQRLARRVPPRCLQRVQARGVPRVFAPRAWQQARSAQCEAPLPWPTVVRSAMENHSQHQHQSAFSSPSSSSACVSITHPFDCDAHICVCFTFVWFARSVWARQL